MNDYPHFDAVCPTYDSDFDCSGRRISVATLFDIMQNGATESAARLGVGMTDLMKDGHSWMLASMSACFDTLPEKRGDLFLHTWPSGTKGRLLCLRDYTIKDAAGRSVARATSEWIYVDVVNRKICRLPPNLLTLAPPGVPRVDVEPAPKQPPAADGPASVCEIPVRRADTDINRHVNNVHYVEWLFEPLDDALFARRIVRLDIGYRAEARHGDVVVSEVAPAENGAATVHSLRRKSDGTLLVTAVCHWAAD